jgi:hypothetical protein
MREECIAVILLRRLLHLLGQGGEFGTLFRIGPFCRDRRYIPLELAPDFEQLQLLARIDRRQD